MSLSAAKTNANESVTTRRPGLRQSSDEQQQEISQGSTGHPVSCAPACKYIKRLGGCRDGVSCDKCHLCFWHKSLRSPDAQQGTTAVSHVSSIGTSGHPNKCGPACKYVHRKGGCRLGDACPNCHICKWSRQGNARTGGDTLQEQTHTLLASNGSMGSMSNSITQSKDEDDDSAWRRIRTPSPASDRLYFGNGSPGMSSAAVPFTEMLQKGHGFRSLCTAQPCTGNFVPLADTDIGQTDFLTSSSGLSLQSTGLLPPAAHFPAKGTSSASPSSRGSAGHPSLCNVACRFWTTKKCCKKGDECEFCHLCVWSQEKQEVRSGVLPLDNVSALQ